MPDYGKPLEFGYFLTPAASNPAEVLRLAQLADRLDLDLLGIQDHPYQGGFLDTWTFLSAIAARTERIRVFPDVANPPFRPPAVLAKAAATLDLISGGRFHRRSPACPIASRPTGSRVQRRRTRLTFYLPRVGVVVGPVPSSSSMLSWASWRSLKWVGSV